MWCQNQSFGDPYGCLVGKKKQFGKKNTFLAWKKKPLNLSAQDLKLQSKIFCSFLNFDQNALNL